jgi:hypothetical protein
MLMMVMISDILQGRDNCFILLNSGHKYQVPETPAQNRFDGNHRNTSKILCGVTTMYCLTSLILFSVTLPRANF